MRDEEVLRQRGQRITSQRRLILSIMQRAEGHVTADYVVQEAKLFQTAISTASVYRILAWLTEYELICVTDVGERDLVYEYLGAGRHHHLICQKCGTQVEVPFDIMAPVVTELREHYGFEPRIDHQAIFGMCQHCRDAAKRGVTSS